VAPIAADLSFADEAGARIDAEFDWRQTGQPSWDIHVETDAGRVTVGAGGRRLIEGERSLVNAEKAEYPAIYRHFVELIANGVSDVDLSPLIHVADAFMLGRRHDVDPFKD
jgi:D-galactose 1-dehydrogenase